MFGGQGRKGYRGVKSDVTLLSGLRPDDDSGSLREEEFFVFQQLIDQSNDALFILDPPSGRIIYANQKASDQLGYTRQELRDLRVNDYAGNVADLPAWQILIRRLRDEDSVVVETLQTCKDGSTVPVEANIKLVNTGNWEFVISVARDISRRKAAENALIEEHQKQEALIAAMSDGVTMQDTDFRIIYQSKVHQQKQGNHLGEFCYQAYRGLNQICEGCLLAKAFDDGKTHRRETKAMTAEGPFYMEVVCTPLTDAQGHITSGIEVVRDITERKKVEQMKEDMLSSVSHEMRTPLTAMIGFTEFLLNNEVDKEQRNDYLQTILKESERLQDLIDNLLNLQHLRSGRRLAKVGPMSVGELLDDLARLFEKRSGRQRLAIECQPVLPSLEADREMLHIALKNLLDNAFKYAPDGDTVTLRATLQGNDMLFSVTDEGPGIPGEEQQRIFDRFYRADFPVRSVIHGTGIGLALVHEIANAHGGRVWVESRPGCGSTFHLSLPALVLGGDSAGIAEPN